MAITSLPPADYFSSAVTFLQNPKKSFTLFYWAVNAAERVEYFMQRDWSSIIQFPKVFGWCKHVDGFLMIQSTAKLANKLLEIYRDDEVEGLEWLQKFAHYCLGIFSKTVIVLKGMAISSACSDPSLCRYGSLAGIVYHGGRAWKNLFGYDGDAGPNYLEALQNIALLTFSVVAFCALEWKEKTGYRGMVWSQLDNVSFIAFTLLICSMIYRAAYPKEELL